jgi:hypothetical protein
MVTPYERTRAVVETRELLMILATDWARRKRARVATVAEFTQRTLWRHDDALLVPCFR